MEDTKVGDNRERTPTGKKFKGFKQENSWGDVFSVLSNSWITVAFYVVIAAAITYFLYKSVRKKLTKSEIEQEKQSETKRECGKNRKERESHPSVKATITYRYDKENVS